MRRCSAVDFRSVTEEKDGWRCLMAGLAAFFFPSSHSDSLAFHRHSCLLSYHSLLSLFHQKVIKIAVAGEDRKGHMLVHEQAFIRVNE